MADNIIRLFQTTTSSFFLFGPRGTGKSTWLKKQYPVSIYIDLLDDKLYRKLLARPESLNDIILGRKNEKIVIIDGIQKVPELLSVVHKLIEEYKSFQFILTGSSSRKLKRAGVDLLGGRAILKKMYPFTAAELGNDFSINNALLYGLIPLIYQSKDKEDALAAYINLYLKEEVHAEGLVRNISSFARFLEIMSFSHGQIINYSEIARECQVKRHLVEEYTNILEDLLIAYRISPFFKRAKRILVKSSKFYFFDSGIFNTLRPKGSLDSPSEIGGAALEGLVLHHLIAWLEYGKRHGSVYFWQTKSGNEVDFVVYGNNDFYGIEVKHSKSIRKKDLHGLKAFKEDYPEAKVVLLYMGDQQLLIDSILCVPCTSFLVSLHKDKNPLFL
ncbi:MAG: ATP-binding protein [Spirochaetia bacterium]|nr:ATP-binding protein [Spirochaetia bacterium]